MVDSERTIIFPDGGVFTARRLEKVYEHLLVFDGALGDFYLATDDLPGALRVREIDQRHLTW